MRTIFDEAGLESIRIFASGNLEAGRSGGRPLREGASVRNAMLAVALPLDRRNLAGARPASKRSFRIAVPPRNSIAWVNRNAWLWYSGPGEKRMSPSSRLNVLAPLPTVMFRVT